MRREESIQIDNKGISLIEIIIVLAIMAIIGGAFFLTTSIATDKHVTSCAEKISASLEQTRNLAMGKQSGYILISQAPGDYVYCQMYVDGQAYGDRVAIGHSGLTVKITPDSGSPYILSSVTNIRIDFSRSNGSVTNSPAIKEIVVTNGHKSMLVKIDKFTGRVSVERI